MENSVSAPVDTTIQEEAPTGLTVSMRPESSQYTFFSVESSASDIPFSVTTDENTVFRTRPALYSARFCAVRL